MVLVVQSFDIAYDEGADLTRRRIPHLATQVEATAAGLTATDRGRPPLHPGLRVHQRAFAWSVRLLSLPFEERVDFVNFRLPVCEPFRKTLS